VLQYFWSYGSVYALVTDGADTYRQLLAPCSLVRTDPNLLNFMIHVRPWLDLTVRTVIPFSCLLICNVCIIFKLFQQKLKRKAMSSSTASTENNQGDSNMRSLAVMLVTVSFVYLVCHIPLQTMYLIYKVDPWGSGIPDKATLTEAMLWALCLNFYCVNYSINFIFYCICGKQFRADLISMLQGCCRFNKSTAESKSRTVSTIA